MSFADFFSGEPRSLVRVETVVVVGSSGSIKKRGAEIDAHQLVVRMNTAPTRGFEARVGKRTDIRLVAHNAVRGLRREHLACRILIIWGEMTHYKKVAPLVAKLRRTGLEIWRLTEQAMREADATFERETGVGRLASGAWLSTGWFALQVAQTELTDGDVTAVGFGLSNGSGGSSYHYWERMGGKEGDYMRGHQKGAKGHRFFTEMEIFKRWERIKFI